MRLASRGSTLALWQAHHVQRLLQTLRQGLVGHAVNRTEQNSR